MHFADVVVVAVVVAQWRRAGFGGSIGSMGKPWSYPSSEVLHRVDALDLSSCSFWANSDQRSAYSCSLGVVAVRRPSRALGGLGVGRILLKDIWGEGATSKLPFGMHALKPPNP